MNPAGLKPPPPGCVPSTPGLLEESGLELWRECFTAGLHSHRSVITTQAPSKHLSKVALKRTREISTLISRALLTSCLQSQSPPPHDCRTSPGGRTAGRSCFRKATWLCTSAPLLDGPQEKQHCEAEADSPQVQQGQGQEHWDAVPASPSWSTYGVCVCSTSVAERRLELMACGGCVCAAVSPPTYC